MFIYFHVYIYIDREREKSPGRPEIAPGGGRPLSIDGYIEERRAAGTLIVFHICVYIYTYISKERRSDGPGLLSDF